MSSDKKVLLIVLDSAGIGFLPDADKYGDVGSNTLGNCSRAVGGLNLPNLGKMGLGLLTDIAGVPPVDHPEACYGKMAERSPGKDTTTGHWEMSGIILDRPFPVYPDGFPPEIIEPFKEQIGRDILGNKAASGTAIIDELGPLHIQTAKPIVYTSADSVFQIAAHEEVIPLEELYRMCGIARELLTGKHAVGRVIARPFVGTPGNFNRTANRHDFSLKPPARTVLNLLKDNNMEVAAVGKINDIFAGEGVTESVHTVGNMDGVDKTLELARRQFKGLIFTNLVDFDQQYGHRNDFRGYAAALEEFDQRLPEIIAAMQPQDVLMITADHGCDPTTASTDHSREYVPLLVYGKQLRRGINLGTRSSFSDIGATIAGLFGLIFPVGECFLEEILI
ncbi:phosphopentomutase [Desulfotomaculum arcticum]|uniref:Phosphopentomutase n=1 Tax=Desulfotruncus arcticus DSM 17038 TaxID=1121424 RepID=A0A1I2MRW6_9FIRM|nr:phosphopentomutase [Desulfotruncus arcticus]SFF94202.1 phosphopentomutase [Desulfotomaculum arcticum] [Desulfotruncus arcticus DSM 17038]